MVAARPQGKSQQPT